MVETPDTDSMSLIVEVAILGHTNYSNRDGAANMHPDLRDGTPGRTRAGFQQSDVRGSVQYHEGLIYPGGTIPAPTSKRDVTWNFPQAPLGTMFDRGWIVINNRASGPYVPRPDPHLLSYTDFYLGGVVGADNLTPEDMLVVVGLQHDNEQVDPRFLRAIIGGTGRFATACGQVIQKPWGYNSSRLRGLPGADAGAEPPAPNFRFEFEIWL